MLGLGLGLTTRRRRALWTPAALPGTPREWLAGPTWCFTDTAGTVPAGDTDAVAAWRDRWQGTLVTQTDPLRRPVLRLVSGKWVVRFDGINDFLNNTASLYANQPVTFGYRANSTPATSYIGNVFDGGDGLAGGNASRLASGVLTGGVWRMFGGTGTVSGGTYAAGWATIAGLASGAGSLLRQNGTQVGTGNPGSAAFALGISIGCDTRNFDQPFNGDVASVVVTGANATADFAALEAYLNGVG